MEKILQELNLHSKASTFKQHQYDQRMLMHGMSDGNSYV